MTVWNTTPRPFWGTRDGLIDIHRARSWGDRHVSRVATQLQIEEAFARFGIAHDENRVEVLLSVFTEDGELAFGSGSATADLTFRGHRQIGEELSWRLPSRRGQKRHCITNVLVERVEGEVAEAVAYGVVTRAASGVRVQSSVLYRADLRRGTDTAWRFTRLFIGVDDYAGET